MSQGKSNRQINPQRQECGILIGTVIYNIRSPEGVAKDHFELADDDTFIERIYFFLDYCSLLTVENNPTWGTVQTAAREGVEGDRRGNVGIWSFLGVPRQNGFRYSIMNRQAGPEVGSFIAEDGGIEG